MFGKKKDTHTRKPPKPTANIDTFIGSSTRVNGDMEFRGGLHIDGYIKGNIQAELESNSVLRISENGVVEGAVSVPQVILEKSRGTQMSVQGIHVEYGCWACDPPEVKVRGGRTHHLPDRLGGSQ